MQRPAREDLPALGEVFEHQPRMHQVELVVWQLTGADVQAADFNRVAGERFDEPRVDVDRHDRRAAVGHPLHQ